MDRTLKLTIAPSFARISGSAIQLFPVASTASGWSFSGGPSDGCAVAQKPCAGASASAIKTSNQAGRTECITRAPVCMTTTLTGCCLCERTLITGTLTVRSCPTAWNWMIAGALGCQCVNRVRTRLGSNSPRCTGACALDSATRQCRRNRHGGPVQAPDGVAHAVYP